MDRFQQHSPDFLAAEKRIGDLSCQITGKRGFLQFVRVVQMSKCFMDPFDQNIQGNFCVFRVHGLIRERKGSSGHRSGCYTFLAVIISLQNIGFFTRSFVFPLPSSGL